MNEAPSKPTVDDTIDSLTGYEELQIEQLYDAQVSDLLATRPTMGLRALVYAIEARKTDSAKGQKTAMGMTINEVSSYFAADADTEVEVMADEPVTDLGKEDSPSD